eukprot:PRCOL_00005453-RA
MMGRKAAKVAKTKGREDAKRSKLYGKYGKLLVNAVKKGGGSDPVANAMLRDVIKQAQAASVPRDLIERNLKKAESKDQADFVDVTYEAYGAGGCGMVISASTDNTNRANEQVQTAVKKAGGKMAESGSVLFNFKRAGVLVLADEGADAEDDDLVMTVLEAGGEDVLPGAPADDDGEGGSAPRVTCEAEDFASVRDALVDAGVELDLSESGLEYMPLADVEVGDDDAAINDAIIERLLDCDGAHARERACANVQRPRAASRERARSLAGAARAR